MYWTPPGICQQVVRAGPGTHARKSRTHRWRESKSASRIALTTMEHLHSTLVVIDFKLNHVVERLRTWNQRYCMLVVLYVMVWADWTRSFSPSPIRLLKEINVRRMRFSGISLRNEPKCLGAMSNRSSNFGEVEACTSSVGGTADLPSPLPPSGNSWG